MASKSVALITTSLRPARVGANVAALVQPILNKVFTPADIKLVPVDLRDFKLPIFNENVAPASKCPSLFSWTLTGSIPLRDCKRKRPPRAAFSTYTLPPRTLGNNKTNKRQN